MLRGGPPTTSTQACQGEVHAGKAEEHTDRCSKISNQLNSQSTPAQGATYAPTIRFWTTGWLRRRKAPIVRSEFVPMRKMKE